MIVLSSSSMLSSSPTLLLLMFSMKRGGIFGTEETLVESESEKDGQEYEVRTVR